MAQYSWADCPAPVREHAERLTVGLRDLLAGNLVGVYLHGSLALGCFNPTRSDLDILAVTRERMPLEVKRRLGELLLCISDDPFPIEISFVTLDQLHPWRYPPPFDLHYSESWREKYRRELGDGSWQRWDRERTDVDLAAHITILCARGITLFGAPLDQTLPAVPPGDYLASIWSDYEEVVQDIALNPVYSVLNTCRVYRYLTDGEVTSKAEAGEWAIARLPEEVRSVVEGAMGAYTEDRPFVPPGEDLERFARLMGERLRVEGDERSSRDKEP
jgi:streptomycin 3"-adenylyltransferase